MQGMVWSLAKEHPICHGATRGPTHSRAHAPQLENLALYDEKPKLCNKRSSCVKTKEKPVNMPQQRPSTAPSPKKLMPRLLISQHPWGLRDWGGTQASTFFKPSPPQPGISNVTMQEWDPLADQQSTGQHGQLAVVLSQIPFSLMLSCGVVGLTEDQIFCLMVLNFISFFSTPDSSWEALLQPLWPTVIHLFSEL